MDSLQALILGLLQGVTEFLPISSSGHLVLGEHFLGLDVASLRSFDVVVHMGTLLAILIYFWRDIWGLISALFKWDFKSEYGRMIGWILLGTVPAVAIGLSAGDYIDATFRTVASVGIGMMVVGLIFFVGESVKVKPGKLTWWKALLIGVAQAFALIPGVSRSGSTIVAGLFQGIDRVQAARFSFLLGVPAIAGAGLLTGLKGDFVVDFWPLAIGFFSSFAAGLVSVYFLMRFLKKHSLRVFGGYLLLLGVILLLTS